MNNKEAIKRLKEVIEDCTSGEDEPYREAFGMGILALEKQLNGGWIPVSERLPSNTQRVLVTLENKMVLEVFYINNKFKFIGIVEGGGMKEIFKDNPVIAWQPLPEPYKEAEHED